MHLFHQIIQVMMGWKNYNLYQFEVGDLVIANKRLWDEIGPTIDVKEVSEGEVFTKCETQRYTNTI